MRSAWLLPILLLAACSSDPRTPGVLQRFDRLRPELAAVARGSARVALDDALMDDAVRAGKSGAARRAAGGLAGDAITFARDAGRAGNRVRALARLARKGPVHMYLLLARTALAWQWREGRALVRLSQAVWRDPSATVPGDADLILRLDLDARWRAWHAVLAAQAAARIVHRQRSLFRYAPSGR